MVFNTIFIYVILIRCDKVRVVVFNTIFIYVIRCDKVRVVV